MTKYTDGRKLEYAVQKALEADGYWTQRAPGSKGVSDVIGIKLGEILLVQCKLDGVLSRAERIRLIGLAAMLGAVPLAARWHKEGRAARQVQLYQFHGIEPGQSEPWTADHGFEVIA